MVSSRKRLTKWNAQSVAALSDDELIQVWAQAFADRSVLKEGDLTIENRIKHGAPPESIDLLLQEAERRAIPLATLANRVVADAMAGKSFVSTLVAPPSWRRYEKKASHAIITLLRSEGIRLDRVEFDARVKGRITGEDRQIDLLLVRNQPLHVVACEFREYPDRFLAVDKVEAFASKLQDVEAQKGVLVTPSGYQRGAVATAKHHGIVLYRLREAPPAEVRRRYPDHANDVRDDRVHWVLEKDDQSWVFSEAP